MERKHIGLAARQTKINGEACATEEIGTKGVVLHGSADSCSLEKVSGKKKSAKFGG